MEKKLYNLLLANTGEIVSSEQIVSELVGYTLGDPAEYARPMIARLRKKLGADSIKTVRGKGFILIEKP